MTHDADPTYRDPDCAVDPGSLEAAPGSRDELLDQLDATVLMLGRLMAARHSEACKGPGLNPAQALALRLLSQVGQAKIGDVAAALGIKAPAASSLIESLDKAGLVTREISPEDRRVTLVGITEAGRKELAAAEAERREHIRRYMAVLSDDDLHTLIRIQRTLIEAMTADRI